MPAAKIKIHELTMKESIDMALHGFIMIDDEPWYKIAKKCYLGEAMIACGNNDMIAKNRSMHFILSKTQKHEPKKRNPFC